MREREPLHPCEQVTTTEVGHRILRAAAELFYERGIGATGVDLIAEAAHTTKRTLYQRFGSKDALVAAYLQDRAHHWQVQLLALPEVATGASSAAAVTAVFEAAVLRAETATRGCAFVNAWAEVGARPSEAAEVIRSEKAWMRRLFRRWTDDDATASAVHQLYEGAQVLATVSDGPEALRSAAGQALRLLRG